MLKSFSRWILILAAMPAGGAGGFFSGYYLAYGILALQGMGNSHNDMFTCVAAGTLGTLIGAVLLPIAAFILTRGAGALIPRPNKDAR